MTTFWYAMRSKPKKEDFLARQLESYNVELYYPRIHAQPVNPRARKFQPFLPGYLFVHVDLDVINTSTLRWMPGASDLVSFDGKPASVPDLLIAALKRQIDQHNASTGDLTKDLQSGDPVLIQDGPFKGYEALFDVHLSGGERVRVLLNLLQRRQVPLELQTRQIRSKKHP